jgi:DnaJ-domain-containing protein 1
MKTGTKRRGNELQEDIEQINRRIQEFLEDIQRMSEKLLRDAPQKLFERAGTDFTSFGGMKGQSAMDPYRILGLDKTASDGEIKKRYRERLRQFHPDTAGPGMEFHLQTVMAAYELIKRARGW